MLVASLEIIRHTELPNGPNQPRGGEARQSVSYCTTPVPGSVGPPDTGVMKDAR